MEEEPFDIPSAQTLLASLPVTRAELQQWLAGQFKSLQKEVHQSTVLPLQVDWCYYHAGRHVEKKVAETLRQGLEDAGYEKVVVRVSRSLNISFQLSPSEVSVPEAGQTVLALDRKGYHRVAIVLSVYQGWVAVHFQNWPMKYDECFPIDAHRLKARPEFFSSSETSQSAHTITEDAAKEYHSDFCEFLATQPGAEPADKLMERFHGMPFFTAEY